MALVLAAVSMSPTDTNTSKGYAASRYETLANDRAPFLDRARECSKLTIPYLLPEEGMENQKLPSLYQSVGANGVTNLASKLLMTMLPPNEACFRLRVNNLLMEAEEEEIDKEFRTRVEKHLSRIEQSVLADIEEKGDRSVVFEGNQHLIVSGNGLYYDDPEKGLRFFPLTHYVVNRDPSGNPIEIITKETLAYDALDAETRSQIDGFTILNGMESDEKGGEREGESSVGDKAQEHEKEIDIYTHLTREGDMWNVYQEVKGHTLEGSTGSYKVENCPWFPVRMYSIAGENYGRSFVEAQLGDLTSLESLSQALVEGSAVSALAIGLVNPNGITSAKALTQARNGDFIEGRVEDVQFLQMQKSSDLNITHQQVQKLEISLKTNFLMMEGVRRDGERVTAEEIRTLARELEAGLGGVYTLISQEFQLPFIRARMKRMTDEKKLPALPKGVVAPSIVTGFEALGRGNDKQKLTEFLQFMTQGFGEAALQYLNVGNAIQRLANAMGISVEGLIKTDEELQQERQQAQAMQEQASQQEFIGKISPEIIRQFGNNLPPEMVQQVMGGAVGTTE